MVNLQHKNLFWLSAVAFVGICAFNGAQAWKSLDAVAKAQANVSEGLQRYQQSFQAAASSRERWEKNYPKQDADADLMSLVSYLGLEKYGLLTEVDTLTLTKMEQVKQGETAIGLTRICLANGSGDGSTFVVISETYETLLTGIGGLSKRPDVEIANISLIGTDSATASARLGDFCVLMRNG